MRLKELLQEHSSAREIEKDYEDQLRWALTALERCAGRPLTTDDFSPELVNHHIQCCRRKGMRDESRKSRLRNLLVLWHAAADRGLAPEPPRRQIVRIKVADRIPTAWTIANVRILLGAAGMLHGTYRNGIAKSAYWQSYIRAAWDTGLRGVDLRRFRTDQVAERVRLIQHKTGKRIRIGLQPLTLVAIHKTYPPQRDVVWPLWGRLELWRREAKKIVRRAGLRGGIGRLRHSSGTAFEILHPQRGHEHLGNTRKVFQGHYLDQDLIEGAVETVEEL